MQFCDQNACLEGGSLCSQGGGVGTNSSSAGSSFLKGERVNLVVIDPARHCENGLRWVNDPDVRKFLAGRLFPLGFIAERDWCENASRGCENEIQLAIELKDGTHVGNIGLHKVNWVSRHAETGALIGDGRYRSKGFGTEAKLLLLQHAFLQMNLHKLYSKVAEYNPRSLRYSLKCGYQVEARLRDDIWCDGRFWACLVMSVYRDDWLRLFQEGKLPLHVTEAMVEEEMARFV